MNKNTFFVMITFAVLFLLPLVHAENDLYVISPTEGQVLTRANFSGSPLFVGIANMSSAPYPYYFAYLNVFASQFAHYFVLNNTEFSFSNYHIDVWADAQGYWTIPGYTNYTATFYVCGVNESYDILFCSDNETVTFSLYNPPTPNITIEYFAIYDIDYGNPPVVDYTYEVNYTVMGVEDFTCSITCDDNTSVDDTPYPLTENHFFSSAFSTCTTPGNHTLEVASCTSDDTSVTYYDLASTSYTIEEQPTPDESNLFMTLFGWLFFLIAAIFLVYLLFTSNDLSIDRIVELLIAIIVLGIMAAAIL